METQKGKDSKGSNLPLTSSVGNESKTDVAEKEEALSDFNQEILIPITSLPEVVLVNIMEYLSLRDCYNLSVTCKVFHKLFSHPQLWQTAHIALFTQGGSDTSRNLLTSGPRSVMHKTMAEIVQRFSHMFQHLNLEIFGYVQPFDDHSRCLLEDLNRDCHLESLTLKLGALIKTSEHMQTFSSRRSNYSDLPLVVGLVKNAVRLKKISIVSWPIQIQITTENDIFQALIDNQKIKGLKSLGLFYVDAKQDSWSERNPKLPSPEATLKLVSHFKNLSHLSLRSPMLSNNILLELASNKRSKLSLFQILIVYSKDSGFQDGYNITEISAKAWMALKLASPAMKVEFLVLTRIPQDQISLILKPEVPLSSLTILEHGRCDSVLIEKLTDMYKNSLEKFVSHCESSDCDQALLNLVESCTRLQRLGYHGSIHHQTIIKMAEIIKRKGLELTFFEFKEKNIETTAVAATGAETDNVVVARDPEKEEYYLVDFRTWHRDEDKHRQTLDAMKGQVSHILGFRWQPLV